MRNYLNYTDDDIIKYAAEVKSIAELLQKLNLKLAGGNYTNIKRKLQQLNLDCLHWTGQSWNKGQRLKDWSNYKGVSSLKLHIIKDKGYKCEQCGLTKWQNKLIPLEIDHIDGDKTNNKESI